MIWLIEFSAGIVVGWLILSKSFWRLVIHSIQRVFEHQYVSSGIQEPTYVDDEEETPESAPTGISASAVLTSQEEFERWFSQNPDLAEVNR